MLNIRFIPMLAVFTLLACTLVQAQTKFTPYDELPGLNKNYKPAYSADYPDWAKMLYNDNLNFYTINEAFDDYVKQHPDEKSPVIRYFKIWRKACEPYVSADGSIRLPDLTFSYNKRKNGQADASKHQSKSTSSNAAWTFLGPKETYWLNTSGSANPPGPAPWQVNVYSFDVAPSDNNILYCGTETGFVNKTVDKGLSWQMLGKDIYFGGAVTAVAVHPQNADIVFIAAGKNIHKSSDGGLSWTALLPSGSLFRADRLRIDTLNTARMFAAGEDGLYVSSDSGNTWTQRWPDQCWDVDIKVNNNNYVFALTVSNSNFALIESTDAGLTFQHQQSFPATFTESSGGLLATTAANPDLMMAVLLSTNNTPYLLKGLFGAGSWTWSQLAAGQTTSFAMNNGQGYFDLVLDISPLNQNIILVGTTTLFKSLNGGSSFTAVGGYTGNFKIHPDIQDIKMLASGETWVSTDGGMNLTTDNFASILNHKIRINGLVGSDMWGFDQGWNEDIIVGGRYHNGNTAIADFYQPKALRMGGAESPTGWVLQGKSRQAAFDDLGGGKTLPATATSVPGLSFPFTKFPNMAEYGGRRGNMVFHPNYYGQIFLGEGTGFWQSTDMGLTWELLYNFNNTVRYLLNSYHNPQVIYADIVGSGLWRSDNGGSSWTQKPALTSPPNGSTAWNGKLNFAISWYDENTLYACLQNGTWSADIGKVFRSTDGGNTWEDWTGTLDEYMKTIVIQPGTGGEDLVYLFTSAIQDKPSMVYYRKPGMPDWLPFAEEYPAGFSVNHALPFFRDSKLRVAGNAGVWESPLQEAIFTPIVNPWVETSYLNCMLDTLHFDDHSVMNHNGAAWHWDITPAPAYIENPDFRNPKVVLGNIGTYDVTLTVTLNGQNYSKTIPAMVTTSDCPAVNNCDNPAELPKDQWVLNYADSQETGEPGLATMSFDNNASTIWHTRWSSGDDPYPHEIRVDLGNTYKIYEFTYLARQDGTNGMVKDYELYLTTDTLNWGLPVLTGQFVNTAAPQTVVFDTAVVGHYFKFRALSEINGNPWASVAEFGFVGCYHITGIDNNQHNSKSITAFPVPTNGQFSLSLPNAGKFTYSILTIHGQIIETGNIPGTGKDHAFNLFNKDAGIYFIVLTDENGITYRLKIIKQ